jgi:hypothetical protein
MKISVLIVCVLNVLVFFWEFHNGAMITPLQQPVGLPTILLVEEDARAQRGAEISNILEGDANAIAHPKDGANAVQLLEQVDSLKTPTQAVEANKATCYEFGPFPTRKAAREWMATQAIAGRLLTKTELVPVTFLLYAPLEPDLQKRRIFKQMLIDKGVKDFFVFSNGELKNNTSFGVFNDKPHADRYQQHLAQLGIQAQIKERFITRASLFVSFTSQQAEKKNVVGALEVVCKV